MSFFLFVTLLLSAHTHLTRERLQQRRYEEKKGDAARNVFPADLDVIPAFSVVEIMFSPANQGGFDQGYGMSIGRVRPCEFSLYSLLNPLGLGLLPATYEESITRSEAWRQANPGLGKVLEEKNTGFFGKVVKGAYLIRYVPSLSLSLSFSSLPARQLC